METARADIQTRITNQIIEKLEQGVRPWAKPWNAEHAAGRIDIPLRWNGQRYRGINVLVLWLTGEVQGYSCPLWLTFHQCKELGGNVKKGEKSTHVVYCDKVTKDEGTDDEREVFFTRTYCVFNAEQTEGLPAHYYAKAEPQIDPVQRIERADAFIKNTGAIIKHGGNSAHYSKIEDAITLPPFEFFRDPESYYATAIHELTHWTGHASRLSRDLKSRKDRDSYAFEELVAEIGAAFGCAELTLTPEVRDDHASYLAHWLEILKSDKRAIFQAAALAQRAADYLMALQPASESENMAGSAALTSPPCNALA